MESDLLPSSDNAAFLIRSSSDAHGMRSSFSLAAEVPLINEWNRVFLQRFEVERKAVSVDFLAVDRQLIAAFEDAEVLGKGVGEVRRKH